MVKKVISEDQAAKSLEQSAKKVTDGDLMTVINKADEIKEKFKSKEPLERFVDDAVLLISLINDFHDGNYREVPWWVIANIAAALLYVLNPLDLVPDIISDIGYLDDAVIFDLCLRATEQDLKKYEDWKTEN